MDVQVAETAARRRRRKRKRRTCFFYWSGWNSGKPFVGTGDTYGVYWNAVR
jgi:hypothetical protein